MITVTNLSKSYGKVEAVKNLSFTVEPGEVYGLLGPNGAGKSTTINIISGLLKASEGEVTVGGYKVIGAALDAKRIIGVVPQQSIVIDELSAMQNCMFFGSLYGMKKARLNKRAGELLDWIGLSDRSSEAVSGFSGGMLRRLTLILGLLHEPRALILDEPTVGLDPQTRLRILDAISEIATRGTAVLLSTHYLEEAERLCNRMGIIDNGRIIKEGSLAELRSAVEDVQIFSMRGSFDRVPLHDIVATIDGGKIISESEEEVLVSLPSHSPDGQKLLEHAAAMKHVKEVAIKPPSLESLFIRLTGREMRD